MMPITPTGRSESSIAATPRREVRICGAEDAAAVAMRLESGTVWVNEIHHHGVDIPFGGVKQSGMGVEHGHEGLAEFTNTKTLMVTK